MYVDIAISNIFNLNKHFFFFFFLFLFLSDVITRRAVEALINSTEPLSAVITRRACGGTN